MLRACLFLLLTFAAPAAHPGAWPRGEGAYFSASTARISAASGHSITTSTYLDIGLPRRRGLTFELDVSGGRLTKALAFYQLGLTAPDRPVQVAAAFGGGTLSSAPVLAPRLFIGRGFQVNGLSGWAEATLGADLSPESRNGTAKLDLTLGLGLRPRLKTYVQLFSTWSRGGPDARFEGSLAYRVLDETWIDLGLSTGLAGGTDHQLKIGLWTAF